MPITATNAVITASSGRKPYRWSPRIRNVITPVMTAAGKSGMWSSSLIPSAAPRNSARSVAIAITSAWIQSPIEVRREKLLAADLREIPARCDPELRRQRLDQHRHQVRRDDHPDEREAELGSARDVRREVAGIHVGHAGDEGRAQEGRTPQRDFPWSTRSPAPGRRGLSVCAGRHHPAVKFSLA